MYYKVINQQSDIYKELLQQREKELAARVENRALLAQRITHTYQKFSGFVDQGARRIPIPVGFYFINPEEVDTTVWREDSKRKGLFYPSKRTKSGREMQQFLDSLQSFSAFRLLEMMGVDYIGEFSIPYMEIEKEVIIVHLDDNHQPKGGDFIEITKKEAIETLQASEE